MDQAIAANKIQAAEDKIRADKEARETGPSTEPPRHRRPRKRSRQPVYPKPLSKPKKMFKTKPTLMLQGSSLMQMPRLGVARLQQGLLHRESLRWKSLELIERN